MFIAFARQRAREFSNRGETLSRGSGESDAAYRYPAGSFSRVAFTPVRIPMPRRTIAPTRIQCAGIWTGYASPIKIAKSKHIYPEGHKYSLWGGRGITLEWSWAARAASKRSNCKGPPGLPCAVTPPGTWPPCSIESKRDHIPVGAGTSAFFMPAVTHKSSIRALPHEIDYRCGQPVCKSFTRSPATHHPRKLSLVLSKGERSMRRFR